MLGILDGGELQADGVESTPRGVVRSDAASSPEALPVAEPSFVSPAHNISQS